MTPSDAFTPAGFRDLVQRKLSLGIQEDDGPSDFDLNPDMAAVRPLITDSLAAAIEAAAINPGLLPPRVLFQTYTNEVPSCQAKTVNVALVAIHRSDPGRVAPDWTEYLVIVPEADGTSRVDDVLFATRRSDTLRARLAYYAATR